jgi:Transposase IS66 family
LHASNKSQIAHSALEQIAWIYDIEREIKVLPPDARQRIRQDKSKPLLSLADLLFQGPGKVGAVGVWIQSGGRWMETHHHSDSWLSLPHADLSGGAAWGLKWAVSRSWPTAQLILLHQPWPQLLHL